ncbi:hypothetical protein PEL8287_02459 [Roseovarius litorisediminis]|uniref:Uncharacterized protein n=1 Tax=Roseovarius litorisediminis TaxID=1312363 RepID=A0A1Y5SV77_9RHOB|nr:hypothetical protein [Roseovarius litorisediminis]SLN47790.1 hypothetical protein PEL8287_02459 [Roseovarius litorisediminis]
MFRKSIRVVAVMALPAVHTLGGGAAFADTDTLGPVPPNPGNLAVLNQLCIDKYGSNQQPRVSFENRRDNALRDADGNLVVDADGNVVRGATITELNTAASIFPPPTGPMGTFGANPTNVIPTKYEDAETCRGTPIPNTLPSTPDNPYNLHDDPVVTQIDKTSPTDDLDWIMDRLEEMQSGRTSNARSLAQHAVDIIEGVPLSGQFKDREYEGFPILHYFGGLKTKKVDGVTKNVVINQIWYDSHIEADANYLNTDDVQNDEWTITYNVKILNRGHEDFAPYMMVFDDPNELDFSNETCQTPMGPITCPNLQGRNIPNVGLDQTFFPMEEGQQYTLNMKMPPARMWNLSYHWGWRVHPPRVQVVENRNVPLANGAPRNAAEVGVFGENPLASEEAKLAAIAMIGDTAPSKRMWRMFKEIADGQGHPRSLDVLMPLIRQAFYDWSNRNQLPTGYEMADWADMTVLFLNNTIYGQVRGHDGEAQVALTDDMWLNRGDTVNVQLLNGDYFVHAYVLVDFGGVRGWENTFHNTLPIGGAGPLFTFGRNYFWINIAGNGPIPVPPAVRPTEPVVTPHASYAEAHGHKYMRGHNGNAHGRGNNEHSSWGGLMMPVDGYTTAEGIGEHKVIVNFNYEPSRRLRMYQFDALHHDVAVWSVH